MLEQTEAKYLKLKEFLRRLESAVIAFSAGVDSTLLLKVAHDELGDNVVAVTAVSPTYPSDELEQAKHLSNKIGARLILINTREFEKEEFFANTPQRCFFCKTELFSLLKEESLKLGFKHILYGANADDTNDFRPGMKAAQQAHAIAPLLEVGLTKSEIREISKYLGLETWNKPSYACLASRIPYGTRITPDILKKIEIGEKLLHELGFVQSRIRYHGDIARIEVLQEELPLIIKSEIRTRIIKQLKEQGFKYITVDIEGYRTGSMNQP
ncbi:MAG: ATP-dependent sacrificial sulfur transferase LarE [bacterium]